MASKMHLSVSPHIHSGRSTTKIMLDVIIALIPTTIAGAAIFGLRSLFVILACVGTCILSELLFNLIVRKKQTVGDLSAIVTGLLLALNLPANIPLWQAVIGSLFAIIIVKCIFGGIGKNLVNPAITARVFMLISFGTMATAASPWFSPDTVSSATPLVDGNAEKLASLRDIIVMFFENPDKAMESLLSIGKYLLTLLLGNHGGAIGEVCAIALIIGGIYLLARKVITWHIPVVYIVATFLISLLFNGFNFFGSLALILSGGLMLGAIFMATDYVTSPSTAWGKVIFGLGAALLTVIIRSWSNYPEGVSFAILLMNIVAPYIDNLTRRKLFGGKKA